MTDAAPLTGPLREEYQAIAARLEAANDGAGRDEVKREIIAFFRKVDGALGELGQLKEDIRLLVERYKQGQAGAAPAFTSARPALHEDHLVASTFIE